MIPRIPDWVELQLVMPEIWLIAAMCAVILVPFVKRDSASLPAGAAVVGLVLALLATLSTMATMKTLKATPDFEGFQLIFSGMLAVDHFSQFFKVLLTVFTLFVVAQWWIASRKQLHVKDVPDFLCLLLGATLGMSLMASASNLLMIFIAIESASLPSFALAGFRKMHRVSSEGSLKYVLFGAASSGVMLYGMSLIYGSVGSLDLGTIAAHAAQGTPPLLAIGLAAMFVGFAFKLSAVPLHFWCPDVFQGAPIEVTTFLSVASKGAAVCLLVRVLGAFGLATVGGAEGLGFAGLSVGIAILGATTAVWGNLVALHQTNIKRLLAYSSISHAGYMMMAASLIAGIGGSSQTLVGAILFYLLIYVFMNLGAFTTVALISQQTGQEDLRDYTGLIRRCPVLAVLLTLFLFSLFGMPGLGGFMGKIYLMKSMADAGHMGFVLIAVLLLNTLISLYYYMRPVYYMVFVTDDEDRPAIVPQGAGVAMLLGCAAVLLWTGIFPATAGEMTRDYAVMIAYQEDRFAPPSHLAATKNVVPPKTVSADLEGEY